MEPAHTIIEKLGGATAIAKAIGIHRTRVSSWKLPRKSGGTNGRVPQNHIPALLALARRKGVALTPADFLDPEAHA